MRANIAAYVKANIRVAGRRVEPACRTFARWWVEVFKKILVADRGLLEEDAPLLLLLERLLDLLNGDWRINNWIVHHCVVVLVCGQYVVYTCLSGILE